MPRVRKFIFNNHVHFITCSVEEGIMLPANPLVKFLIKSAMLRAMTHHPITISHFIVNGTHIHMIVRVDNPEDIPGFMERFKTESAHYINRLLGRKKRKVWCERYDSPRLLEIEDVIEKIVYLYTNPVKDGLISSINDYPGLSSWSLYQGNQKSIKTNLIGRKLIFETSQNSNYLGYKKVLRKLIESKKIGRLKFLNISPNDWLKAFNITEKEDIEEINQKIFTLIKNTEEEINLQRAKDKKPFLGRQMLENQGIELAYRPNRSGRKMWCISANKDLRQSYLKYLKELADSARETYKYWQLGGISIKMPIGVFSPPLPVTCNLI